MINFKFISYEKKLFLKMMFARSRDLSLLLLKRKKRKKRKNKRIFYSSGFEAEIEAGSGVEIRRGLEEPEVLG